MRGFSKKGNSTPREGEQGFILIVVITLILMISGLALMAIRHARQEARSTGTYVDSTQAIALAESAMAVAITDLRRSPDYYQIAFTDPDNQIMGTNVWDARYSIPLDSITFADEGGVAGTLCNAGSVPDVDSCIQILSSPYYDQGGGSAAADLHPGVEFYTTITYDTPIVGPCPPGYSCFNEQNYGWYIFGINVVARYGTQGQWLSGSRFIEHGRAQGSSRVTIGPIGAFGR